MYLWCKVRRTQTSNPRILVHRAPSDNYVLSICFPVRYQARHHNRCPPRCTQDCHQDNSEPSLMNLPRVRAEGKPHVYGLFATSLLDRAGCAAHLKQNGPQWRQSTPPQGTHDFWSADSEFSKGNEMNHECVERGIAWNKMRSEFKDNRIPKPLPAAGNRVPIYSAWTKRSLSKWSRTEFNRVWIQIQRA